MNIIVKSTYPQSDGWGKAARDYLKSFTLTPHAISATPIILSNMVLEKLPEWIPGKPTTNHPDVYFQQCLPQYFDRFGTFRHIGSCFTETRHIQQTGWVDKLNEMDDIIVATEQEKENLEESGVTKRINVVPMPMDFSLLDGCNDELDGLVRSINGRFAFYFIGELVYRKNFLGLIQAYYREFTRDDDVVLVIKTSVGNLNGPDTQKKLMEFMQYVHNVLRMYDYGHHYPEIILLVDKFSDLDIVKLHNSCDCFITLSYGESSCRPLLDAAYQGNHVICTHGIGALDKDLNIVPVQAYETPCATPTPPIHYLYSGWETWMVPDLLHAQEVMRDAYDGKLVVTSRNAMRKFSYESVSDQLNNIL